MIRWILNNIMKWGWDFNHNLRDQDCEPMPSRHRNRSIGMIAVDDDIESDDGINITVCNAIGGRIVTFKHYDRKIDRVSHKIYVVPDDMDFERELGKMITLESMRR
jgi:hypothetical protein